MSGTPVLLDVTDTPGEKERQVSDANTSIRWWRALVACSQGRTRDRHILGSRVLARPSCKVSLAEVSAEVLLLWTRAVSECLLLPPREMHVVEEPRKQQL